MKDSHMTGKAVSIKGTSDGLVITLGEGPLAEILTEMQADLTSRASFFVGGRVALRVGDRPLSVEQISGIGATMEQIGITLWAIESAHPATLVAAEELGLETSLKTTPPRVPAVPKQIPREELAGIVVRRTLRSGQALHHAGHITLLGDVNPGAEVVAGGDIVVWGKLRGTAHAGAMGDDGAVICALQLAPSQIRIGAHIARPPDRGRPPRAPEMASVLEDDIVVERWTKGRRGK
jgi:septum site-determining protein MinC